MSDKKFDYIYLFADFKPVSITENMRDDILKNPDKYTGCPPRIRMGKFYTDDELDRYIEESLKRPLPGEEKPKTFIKKRKFRIK